MDLNAILAGTALFAGFSGPELGRLLPLLSVTQRAYAADATILHAGDENRLIGIVLQGRLKAERSTRAGESFAETAIEAGGVFGDVLSGGHAKSPVSVRAAENSRLLFIDVRRLLGPPPKAEEALFRRLLQNFVALLSNKYFALDKRLDLLLVRGLRRRLAAYLLSEAEAQEETEFNIPFTRAGLAAYLGCERSALSREISRMAADGLLKARGARFMLQNPAALKSLL